MPHPPSMLKDGRTVEEYRDFSNTNALPRHIFSCASPVRILRSSLNPHLAQASIRPTEDGALNTRVEVTAAGLSKFLSTYRHLVKPLQQRLHWNCPNLLARNCEWLPLIEQSRRTIIQKLDYNRTRVCWPMRAADLLAFAVKRVEEAEKSSVVAREENEADIWRVRTAWIPFAEKLAHVLRNVCAEPARRQASRIVAAVCKSRAHLACSLSRSHVSEPHINTS
mmetsp:Transcript_6758/g.20473  ORF Transcript_6758/g.20473 Transcript_6758/m.20473 type:complete len:223 (-) Transcript_6758:216-884(-)|eukprot:scaffold244699_cov32-Tisochrysis_lutea.AAC.1